MPSGRVEDSVFPIHEVSIDRGNGKRGLRFVYALAEPVWMESVSVASKGVGDSCCKILSENTLARRERGRFCGKPPRGPILQQREPRNYLCY